jgi:metal-dependent amidase/aminoacylase/carboxypeptidase family protein
MSLFLKERPGCYFRIGAGFPGEVITHHQAHFRIDEAALLVGLRMGIRSILDAVQP